MALSSQNGGTSNAKYITQLPFQKLSAQSRQADTFQDFPTSLMSVGRTSDDSMVSVFMKEGINVFIQGRGCPHNMQRRTNPHRHPR
jgi:hypothetical protein